MSRRRPIILGGQKVEQSIDDPNTPEPPAPITDAEDSLPAIDWGHVISAVQLDDEEAVVLRARLEGVPNLGLPDALSWDPKRARAARERLDRRIRSGVFREAIKADPGTFTGSNSLRLERLDCGRKVYSHAPLGSVYAEILRAERPKIILERKCFAPRVQTANLAAYTVEAYSTRARGTDESMELNTKLADATNNQKRLMSIETECSEETSKLERDLAAARATAERDEEDALLENRKPNASLQKRRDELSAKVADAGRRLELSQRALARQTEEVARVKAEIEADRHAKVCRELAPELAEFNRIVAQLAPAAARVAKVVNECGLYLSGADIFPAADPSDPLRGFDVRAALCGILNGATVVHHAQTVGGQR